VAQGAFARYSGVVEGACRLQDLLLADLLKLAGPNTLVFLVSDHGFATGAQWRDAPNVPAGIAAHHRPMGIFAACGPGLRGGTILQGASLLDITPTILHACGLPTGDDMDGRVLSEIFAEPRALAPVSTWDGCQSGAEWIAPPPDPENDDELLQRFIQLGYVDANVVNAPEAAAMQRIHMPDEHTKRCPISKPPRGRNRSWLTSPIGSPAARRGWDSRRKPTKRCACWMTLATRCPGCVNSKAWSPWNPGGRRKRLIILNTLGRTEKTSRTSPRGKPSLYSKPENGWKHSSC
jgi:hypothetical protein